MIDGQDRRIFSHFHTLEVQAEYQDRSVIPILPMGVPCGQFANTISPFGKFLKYFLKVQSLQKNNFYNISCEHNISLWTISAAYLADTISH